MCDLDVVAKEPFLSLLLFASNRLLCAELAFTFFFEVVPVIAYHILCIERHHHVS